MFHSLVRKDILRKIIRSFLCLEYHNLSGQCSCLSSFDHPNCTNFDHNSTIIYRTGYLDFGNRLDKRRQGQNNPPITIVFFLTVGGRKNLRQIKRLIRTIYSRQHYYLIHVDSVCHSLLTEHIQFHLC